MMKHKLIGTGVALVTPFDTNLQVDFAGLGKLLDLTANGCDYFVVNGTTGESVSTTKNEKAAILDFVKQHNPKNLPIVYGIGGNHTVQVLETIKESNLDGVSAILSVSPYYNKPSQKGIISHYHAIADASPVPVILYNVPGRTGSNISAATTLELAKHPNIIGIKEASGNVEQAMAIAKAKPDDFLLISGDDLLTTSLIAVGAVGVISVLANAFPKIFHEMCHQALKGDYAKSRAAAFKLLDINPLMYAESNPVGIKEVLKQQGVCGNAVRLPLESASEALSLEINKVLKTM